MKRKKSVSIIGILAFAGAALFAVSAPQSAQATDVPAVSTTDYGDVGITQVVAHGDDNLSLLSCDFTSLPSTDSFDTIVGGVDEGGYPQNGSFDCDPRNGASTDGDITSPDGTVYGTYSNTAVSPTETDLVAINNGRVKWSTSLNYDENCSGDPAHTIGTAYVPTSLSVGSDGNLYMAVREGKYNSLCDNYMLAVNAESGAIIKWTELGFYHSDYMGVAPAVYTYSDKIIAVDPDGKVHQYGYGLDYTEDTDAQYTFPGTEPAGQVFADAAGDVFLLSPGTIYFHGADGINSSISRYDAGDQNFVVGPNGQLVGYYSSGTIYNYHMDQTTPSVTSLSLTLPDGYTKATTYYSNPYLIEDTSGNVVETVQMTQTSTGYPAVGVFYIDASDDPATTLYLKTGDGTSTDSPVAGQADIYSEYMYLPVSFGISSGEENVDSRVEKINVADAGFGTPIRTVRGFSPNSNVTELNYVAMGDSYSSGEGNPTFQQGSDVEASGSIGEDRCHRSNTSYPEEVAADSSLGLNLTDFVACSGADTAQVIGGGSGTGSWNEPAQINSLTDKTKIVTVRIGGNDAAFQSYMTGCFLDNDCGPDSVTYDAEMSLIDDSSFTTNLESAYTAILTGAPNAQVYVADYPYIASSTDTVCDGFDFSGVYSIETELNTKIEDAVDDIRAANSNLHFVETNYSGSPFTGTTLCTSGTSDFNGFGYHVDNGGTGAINTYSFHPNADGQAAYASIFEAAIAAGEE